MERSNTLHLKCEEVKAKLSAALRQVQRLKMGANELGSPGGVAVGDHQITYNFLKSIKPILEKFSPKKVYFVLDGAPLIMAGHQQTPLRGIISMNPLAEFAGGIRHQI